MAKPKSSEVYRMVKFLRESPLEVAELTYSMLRETMAERRSTSTHAPTMSPLVKRRKRGPNKPKVLGASAMAPRVPLDRDPDTV